MEKKRYLMWFTVTLVSLCLIGTYCTGTSWENHDVIEESVIGLVIGATVGIIVAATLLDTIVEESNKLSNDTANFSTTEKTLIDLWPIMVVVGVMVMVVGLAL